MRLQSNPDEGGRTMNVTPPEEAPKGALLLMLVFFLLLVGFWFVLYAELWTRR